MDYEIMKKKGCNNQPTWNIDLDLYQRLQRAESELNVVHGVTCYKIVA